MHSSTPTRSGNRYLSLAVAVIALAVLLVASTAARPEAGTDAGARPAADPAVELLVDRLLYSSESRAARLRRVSAPLGPLLDHLPLEELRAVRLTPSELELVFDFGPLTQRRVRIAAQGFSSERWHALVVGDRVRLALAGEAIVQASGIAHERCGRRMPVEVRTQGADLQLEVGRSPLELPAVAGER